ncbi:MAG TPA: poly(3-hydroxybutyrate) depolymerase [Candidatus Rifleibacterium sp.]|nr:poly(3-hydroxybutyrate) depolymerase [Candidatus Rifleibacterium sp.]
MAAISQETRQKVLEYVKADIDAADLYYTDNVEPACLKRLQRFYSSKEYYQTLFPQLSRRSSFTMSDVADTVYWVMPSLMKIFFGGQDPISIAGRTPDDDAAPMQMLCSWQLQKKNRGFLIFYRWLLDALQLGHAVVKIRWEREEKEVEESDIMAADDFMAANFEAVGVKFVRAEEQPDGTYKVTVKTNKLVKNQPVFDNVPVSEFAWLPDSADVKRLQFCKHKRLMTRSEIETNIKNGIFEKITEEQLAVARYISDEDETLEEFLRDDNPYNDGAADLDTSRMQFWVEECFGKYDINDDNISEDVIVTVIGDTIVRIEENELGRPHFAVLSPYPDQYQLTGRTFDDLIGELQDIKTAIMRQIIVNIANNNDRQAIVDELAINPDDLRDNRKWLRARVTGDRPISSIVSYLPESPMSPAAMPMVEYLDSIKENRTGVTKYNQGLDSKSLNKTATGITAIMSAANQRIEMIARMFAETGVLDLFELLVEMNTRYIDNEQVVRLTEGKSIVIRPDDLKGEYDLDISAGVGAGQRQEATQNMMLLISQIYPALLQLGVPPQIVTGKAVEAAKTLAEQMGYKDASKIVPTPEELQQFMVQQEQMMMAQQQQTDAMLSQLSPEQMQALMQQGGKPNGK